MNEMQSTQTKNVGALLKENFKAISSVLPKHLTPEKMARLILNEVRRNPVISQCTSDSLLGAVLVAAQAGLEVGPFGYCYLIPRKNNKTGEMEVNFQLGYKGSMRLAWNSRDVGSIMPQVVYDTDQFEYELGTNQFIKHVPGSGPPGKITHFYAVAKNLLSGEQQFKVLPKWEVDFIRDEYAVGLGKATSPWKTAYDAMGMKTSIVRLCKFLPMSAESQRIISLDEMMDVGADQNLGAEVPAEFEEMKAAEGKDPRELITAPKEQSVDTSVRQVKSLKEVTCRLCSSPIPEGSDMAVSKDPGGKPIFSHWDCHLDTQNAEDG